jgi:hypothetical protein
LINAQGAFLRDDRPDAVLRTVTERLRDLLHRNPGVMKRQFEQLAKEADIAGQKRAGEFLDIGVQAKEIFFEKNPRGSGGRYYLFEDAPKSSQMEVED